MSACVSGGGRPQPAEAKILLVDDLKENLIALSAVLKTLPASVVCARSGEDALRALMVDDFAAILLDVVMPEMDGFETAHHVKRKDRTRDIPIIFLTAASAEPDLAFRGYAAGAVDYLKPFDPWALRSKVALLVELHELRGRVRAYAALLPGGADPYQGPAWSMSSATASPRSRPNWSASPPKPPKPPKPPTRATRNACSAWTTSSAPSAARTPPWSAAPCDLAGGVTAPAAQRR